MISKKEDNHFNKMEAVTRTKYGSSDVLKIEVVEKPKQKNDEILIRVHATTVNRTDCAILTGKPFAVRFFTGLTKPRSFILGTDFAGQIEAVGKKVTLFQKGDKVWGLNDEGLSSQAQYMTLRENKAVVKIPNKIAYEQVVACAEGAHYAYNFINNIKIKKGDKVLVNGATGAIGSAAVQILKYYEATVTAVVSTKNIKLLKSLGADEVIDYTKTDFTKETKEKYHFIFDAVGKSCFGICKHLLFDKGAYISSGLGHRAENLYLPLITKLTRNKRVYFPIPISCKRSIQFVSELLEKKAFQAVIDKKYSMKSIKKAYQYVASGQKIGNVIINY